MINGEIIIITVLFFFFFLPECRPHHNDHKYALLWRDIFIFIPPCRTQTSLDDDAAAVSHHHILQYVVRVYKSCQQIFYDSFFFLPLSWCHLATDAMPYRHTEHTKLSVRLLHAERRRNYNFKTNYESATRWEYNPDAHHNTMVIGKMHQGKKQYSKIKYHKKKKLLLFIHKL